MKITETICLIWRSYLSKSRTVLWK